VRKISALIVATVVAASLAACSSPVTTAADCTTGVKSGDASSLVTVTAEGSPDATTAAEATPTVSFPTPLFTDGLEKSTLTNGDGQVLQDGDIADTTVYVYDGETETIITGGVVRPIVGDDENPFSKLVECSTVGSRIVATVARDVILAPEAEGAVDDSTVVMIIDITARYLGKANGVEQIPQAGIPSVVLAPNGRPGITIPNETAPAELKTAVLKQGDGATVAENDTVMLNYTGLTWADKSVFASTWEDGAAASVVVTDLDAEGTGVVPGLKKALIGQKVGSQVVVVIPPAEGFADQAPPAGVSADSTLVYVFDVLGIQK